MEIWKPTPMAGVKWLIPRMYTFDDKSQYKTYKIPCKYKYSTVEVNAILRKVKTFLATYVYIPCVISDWYLAKLQGVMEHKKLYRFEAKRNLEEIKSIVRKIINWFEFDFCNADYFDELSLSYIDAVSPDMEKFQKFIEVKLANLGHKNVSIPALSYICFQMLCEGFVNYNAIMSGAKTNYDFDFTELFHYLCPELASEKAKKFMVSRGLSEEFVLKFNEKKEVTEMFANIERIFIDQKMQKNAAKSAFDTLDEETKASMLSGGDEIEKTLNEIETNNLKKKQNEKDSKTLHKEQ